MAICVVIFSLPQVPAAVPWRDEFDWKYVNYAPLTVIAPLIVVQLWWVLGARKRFKGPIREIDVDETGRVGPEPPAGAVATKPTQRP